MTKDSFMFLMGVFGTLTVVLVWAAVSSASEHRACRELTGSTCKWVLVPTYEKVR